MTNSNKKSNALIEVVDHARTVLELIKHPRVNIFIKLIPILAIGYIIVPIDLIPYIPVLSATDDLAVLGVALSLFYVLVPQDVLDEINKKLQRSEPEVEPEKINDQIIDGEFVDYEEKK